LNPPPDPLPLLFSSPTLRGNYLRGDDDVLAEAMVECLAKCPKLRNLELM
jgi:hypothetical protein